jgi:hypothetical protein
MSPSLFDSLPDVLQHVNVKPLFVMRLKVLPLQVIGATPGGFRRIGVVPGGVFEGERLSGEILEGASDWQSVRTDGGTTLDVRLVLKTADNALIGMTYRGVRQGPPDVIARLEKREAVDPNSYYFRMAAFFETAASQYEWLNNIVSVGVGHRFAEGPVYSMFELL